MTTGLMAPSVRRLLAAAFWLAALAVLLLSLLPVDAGGAPAQSDKLVHVLMFFVLALLWQLAYPRRGIDWIGLGGLAAFGLLIECAQFLLPWRSFSLADLLADVAGILLSLGLRPFLQNLHRA